jgi:hypothetical protein
MPEDREPFLEPRDRRKLKQDRSAPTRGRRPAT